VHLACHWCEHVRVIERFAEACSLRASVAVSVFPRSAAAQNPLETTPIEAIGRINFDAIGNCAKAQRNRSDMTTDTTTRPGGRHID